MRTKMKIRITCLKQPANKLEFVKLIKEFKEDGLKDAKEVMDELLFRNSVEFEYDGCVSKIEPFRKAINVMNGGGEFLVNNGAEFERHRKLLSMGLGEEEECIDFIANYFHMFKNNNDGLRSILSYLSKENLTEVIGKLEI